MEPQQTPIEINLVDKLLPFYERKNIETQFNEEKPFNEALIQELRKKLTQAGYQLRAPIGVGSTCTVWLVHQMGLDQDRALKVPRLRKIDELIPVLENERSRLAQISHQNVIRVYGSGEVPVRVRKPAETVILPYFIMECFHRVADFDDAIINNRRSLAPAQVIAYFRDALTGISVLHGEDIRHCDIKPGNLLIAPGKPALVTDLGYAKYLGDKSPSDKAEVRFTPRYAHPALRGHIIKETNPDANVADPEYSLLGPAVDLFAFGRSMQEVLSRLHDAEKTDPPREDGRQSIFTNYQWNYLNVISKRLLDGIVERTTGDELRCDAIPGFGEQQMKEVKYKGADEALEDFEKLLHLYDLEGKVPELHPFISDYVQVPHCRMPLTDRLQHVIDHPAFARLAQVTQLGFVSAVYPGGVHTRIEHVYGTYTHCCDYVRALWYDENNCLFQSIMSKQDIESVLIAALLHDIGQYPMAHDLTEAASDFSHERFTQSVFTRSYPGCQDTLASLVSSEWNLPVQEVLDVLFLPKGATVKHRILHSLISGPIDCDKVDYLTRDSTHLGIPFGTAIDRERLLRNLTLVYQSKKDTGQDNVTIERLEFAEIGIREKALVVASSLVEARTQMFTQVYWQHTARTMKAMLSYAVRRILLRMSEEEKASFWARFHRQIFDPMFHQIQFSRPRDNEERENSKKIDLDGSIENDFSLADDFEDGEEVLCSHLGPTDDAMLLFLLGVATRDDERNILNAIRVRQLYRRILVLSGPRSPGKYDSEYQEQHERIYSKFRTHRQEDNLAKIEELRVGWECSIIDAACAALKRPEKAGLVAPGRTGEDVRAELQECAPLILVDIPVKGAAPGEGSKVLRYLTEDSLGVHGEVGRFVPVFESSNIDLGEDKFDVQVGKVRVLAHPKYRDFLIRCLDRKEILAALSV